MIFIYNFFKDIKPYQIISNHIISNMYHQSTGKVKGKASMYLIKKFDSDIPQPIMTSISMWIDCYNSNISEKTKIKGHYDFENKINDTDSFTSAIKMSSSGKRSENERLKYEKDIFIWLSLQQDKDIDNLSTKISKLMYIDKNTIISNINRHRLENNKKVYNPEYKIFKSYPAPTPASTPVIKSTNPLPVKEKVDLHKSVPEIPKVVEKVFKDAWDDHFSL